MRPIGALLFDCSPIAMGGAFRSCQRDLFFDHRAFVRLFTNFTVFIILRALFGIGMGGEWGVALP